MREKLIRICLFVAGFWGLLTACSKDEASENAKGTFRLSLQASNETLTGTRSAASQGEKEGNAVADVGNFAVAILKGDETLYEWATFEDMEAAELPELRPAVYTAHAWAGNPAQEGFELPSYDGKQDFTVKRNEVTPVKVTCYLVNAQLKIVYTEEFKKYFQTYSASVTTSQGNTVEYAQAEERFAYFKPGNLTVTAKVKKAGQANNATYRVKTIQAKARHAYTLTLDVDAGTETMKVSFSEETAEEEKEFIVSDEALNKPVPFMKARGFVSGQELAFAEGSSFAEKVYAYINAQGNLSGCDLITRSDYLISQGFPALVNLSEPGEYEAVMQRLGLSVRGFGANKEVMAMVDFTNLLANLPVGSHSFVLQNLTDEYGKTSGEEGGLTLNVNVTPCSFTLSAPEEKIPFLSQEFKVRVAFTANGYKDVLQHIRYYIKGAESDTELTFVKAEAEDDRNFVVTLQAPTKIKESFKVSADYQSVKGMETAEPLPVSCGISVEHEGDVWAKKAVFHLFNADCGSIRIQYFDTNASAWKDAGEVEKVSDYQPGTGTLAAVHGLPSDATFKFRALMNEGTETQEASNEQEITTEKELQVPNAGFEEWTVGPDGLKGHGDIKYVIFKGNQYQKLPYRSWERWYPYADNAEGSHWDTLNEYTTSHGKETEYFSGVGAGDHSWTRYVANSGTLQSEGRTGYSALVRTVGWGLGSTANGSADACYNVTPGELYLGAYQNGEAKYGIGFESRPAALSFYYKYVSKAEDRFVAEVRVYSGEEEIGSGVLTPADAAPAGEWTLKKVPISYSNPTLKATSFAIIFKSGTSGAKSDLIIYPGFGDLTMGEYVGSQLYVDDVQLIYE